jgi:hypothetical protein
MIRASVAVALSLAALLAIVTIAAQAVHCGL